ncbi:MAG: hypothetical protein NTX86_03000 [Candidatus Dependentiae bacterium]|nr:hypothetical protein [Candidatus Dependentiae bacterium]
MKSTTPSLTLYSATLILALCTLSCDAMKKIDPLSADLALFTQDMATTRGIVSDMQGTLTNLQTTINNAPTTLYGLAPSVAIAGLGYQGCLLGLKNLHKATKYAGLSNNQTVEGRNNKNRFWWHFGTGVLFVGTGLTAILKTNAIVNHFKSK